MIEDAADHEAPVDRRQSVTPAGSVVIFFLLTYAVSWIGFIASAKSLAATPGQQAQTEPSSPLYLNQTIGIVPSGALEASNPFAVSTSLTAWLTLALLWGAAAYCLIQTRGRSVRFLLPKLSD